MRITIIAAGLAAATLTAASPASAQRRILQRLEAVLSAEHQGLDARRGAVAAG